MPPLLATHSTIGFTCCVGSAGAAGAIVSTYIRLWDVGTGALRQVLTGHTALVRSLVFSADGALLVSGSSDRTVRVWDARTGEPRRILQGQRSSTWSVACSPDRTLVAGGTNDALYIWDIRPSAGLESHPLALHGHTTWVTSIAFSPDGELLASGSGDQTILLWRVRSGEQMQILAGHKDWVYSVAFCPVPEGGCCLRAAAPTERSVCGSCPAEGCSTASRGTRAPSARSLSARMVSCSQAAALTRL